MRKLQLIKGFRVYFEKKEKKLTDTGLYSFSRNWKILLDGKFGHWMVRAKALSINFVNQMYI